MRKRTKPEIWTVAGTMQDGRPVAVTTMEYWGPGDIRNVHTEFLMPKEELTEVKRKMSEHIGKALSSSELGGYHEQI